MSKILEKAVKITPDNGEAFFLLAKAYEGINRKDKATEAFKHAQGQMEENYEVLLNVGQDYFEHGNYEEALKQREKALMVDKATQRQQQQYQQYQQPNQQYQQYQERNTPYDIADKISYSVYKRNRMKSFAARNIKYYPERKTESISD